MANGSDRALLSAIAETPIETYVDALFALAVRKRASDIHLEPQNDGLCVRACAWMDCCTVSPVPLARLLTSCVLASR